MRISGSESWFQCHLQRDFLRINIGILELYAYSMVFFDYEYSMENVSFGFIHTIGENHHI
ncbi:MAG TPA: hypothetical protein DHV39_02790 [Verrucomicrobiales bacterium]|nr:hypothetical protein [Verrucomicrobiales bacterium]